MNKLQKVQEALEFIVHREDFAFAECTEAELIWDKAKEALAELKEFMEWQLVIPGVIDRLTYEAFMLGHSKARQGFLINDDHMEHCQPYIDRLAQAAINVIKGKENDK